MKAAAVIPYDPDDVQHDPSKVTPLKELLQKNPTTVLLKQIKKLVEGEFDFEIQKMHNEQKSNMKVPSLGDSIGVFPQAIRETFSRIINSATKISE